jgi:hypothetical protein
MAGIGKKRKIFETEKTKMKCTKKCIVFAITLAGALISLVSASAAICMLEEKTDICYVVKKKAKSALKDIENKLENKLNM